MSVTLTLPDIRHAQRAAATDVETFRSDPCALPHLKLGSFAEGAAHAVLLRRIVLWLHVPARLLSGLGLGLRNLSWSANWQRFLYDCCYWIGVRQALADDNCFERLISGTTILMYHGFAQRDESTSRYVLPLRSFEQQLAWLRRRRYNVLDLETYLQCRQAGQLPPARSVVITIDDGYADNCLAHQALRQHGMSATIFLVSDYVRAERSRNDWDDATDTLTGRALLTLSDVRHMQRQGMRFGAHTRHHPWLTALSTETQQDEIAGARHDLEAALCQPVLTFTYPHGANDAASRRLAQEAGYLGACDTHLAANYPSTPLFNQHRLEIRGNFSLFDFVLALWVGQHRLFAKWLRK